MCTTYQNFFMFQNQKRMIHIIDSFETCELLMVMSILLLLMITKLILLFLCDDIDNRISIKGPALSQWSLLIKNNYWYFQPWLNNIIFSQNCNFQLTHHNKLQTIIYSFGLRCIHYPTETLLSISIPSL